MSSTATTTVSNFNQIKPDYPERFILKGLRNQVLTKEDARLIRAFVAEMQSARDIGLKRAHKLTYTLVGLRRFIGPFRENDITALYVTINSPISNFCSLCGRPLDEGGAESYEDIKAWFMEHPEEMKRYFETRTKKNP